MSAGDHDLERLFVEARLHDEGQAPSFDGVLAPRRPRQTRSRPQLVMAFVAVVILAGAGIWRLTTPNAPTAVVALTPGDMRVPTDYLLDLATYSRAGEIPRIGAEDWYPVPLPSDARPDTRRQP